MKVWGMLSTEDEQAGFDLVFDREWYIVLKLNGDMVARFDPTRYTMRELLLDLESCLQMARGTPAGRWEPVDMPISEMGFVAMLKMTEN